jgi:hypothetical protein
VRPGGAVVCAIENRFGAQYLAGAPEEHYGRPFVGLEGYVEDGIARTFSRRELERLFVEAGLTPQVQHVFPDYKFARLIYADALLETAATPLTWRAPRFPSDASPRPRARLASEGPLWRGLVDAGFAGECANSFLVVAGVGGPSELWPQDLYAAFYSTRRGAAFCTESRVTGAPERPRLERRRLSGGAGAERAGSLVHEVSDTDWVDGPSLLEALESADEAELSRLLRTWRELVESATDDERDLELIPHNLVVSGDGLVQVDREWLDATWTAADVVDRGLLAVAISLADRRPPSQWPGAPVTVRDLVAALARLAGSPETVDRLDDVIAREAALLMTMSGHAGDADRVAGQERGFHAVLERPLTDTALGERDPDLRQRLETQLRVDRDAFEAEYAHAVHVADEARAEVARLQGTVAHLQAEAQAREAEAQQRARELHDLSTAYAVVTGSRSWRMTGPLRRAAGRLRPGSR